jgi:hypothetical protein
MRRQRILLQYSREQFELKYVCTLLSEKMNNHAGSEVQKSFSQTHQRGSLLGIWTCFSPTAEQRNFLRLLFPTRHGEKEEEKVLNENKGGNGMSEHGLRS